MGPTEEIETCVSKPVDPFLVEQRGGEPHRIDSTQQKTDDADNSWLSLPGRLISGGLYLPKVLAQMASESVVEASRPAYESVAQPPAQSSLYDLLATDHSDGHDEQGSGKCGFKPNRICIPWHQIT